MLDRLLDFMKDIQQSVMGEPAENFSDDDPRLAAAALLLHVMDVDGDRRETERDVLYRTLSEAYALPREAVERLIQAAEKADQEAIDIYGFSMVLKRHLNQAARLEFIELMWEMVYSDGEAHELEDVVMWRLADLLEVAEPDRMTIQQRVEKRFCPQA
ncbi:putative tellurite resistance protein B-like protein [Paenochrobactrum gallinarii]|uniref:Putative tellurite resistance protein B-like protein n=1 Tax=Paenochrobactrum gallinarii TaxID=643673 RepID=A0A841M3Y4_9HYPH|nr:TerB family tellurite resistance protein [Paenochrobactrum gallinarii]MBB6260868.1 putative tellurite resistance protein B-like protein [Paenochrobactrum gallinarii]